MADSTPRFVIRNEFALIEVEHVTRPSGDLLRITDVPGGASTLLDALDLEALCALGPQERAWLRNPEWRMNDEAQTKDEPSEAN
ncbi:hypothetical protein [Mycobacterium paraintracellulare]|uniref:hypothetical protein n=1 Tax=Mycobacterium paraintracellulare TaxID=1138383 RepID=UPI001926FDDC|nr:hypothetical protein [Mycobacterium paraintracellulare]BCP14214.1 hypothetical protein MINTM021_11230 [Mycobacterium paraintracellulare]